jgi:hypothetical protein
MRLRLPLLVLPHRRRASGQVVVPARLFRIRHKNSVISQT